MIIDTHAHLMFEDFRGELSHILSRAREAGVLKIINVGFNAKSSMQALEFSQNYEECYVALGVHPHDASDLCDELLIDWQKIAMENEKVVAIGECGLDYFRAETSKELQKEVFKKQVVLAQKCGLPLIVHNRESDSDCLDILDELNGLDCPVRAKVVFHSFASDLDFAKKLWSRGYFTSFTGIVTFPNAGKVQEVAREVPMDKFMVETDCPYLAPQAYRGKRNEPSYTVEVLKKIAELKNMDFDDICEGAYNNTLRFFDRI